MKYKCDICKTYFDFEPSDIKYEEAEKVTRIGNNIYIDTDNYHVIYCPVCKAKHILY